LIHFALEAIIEPASDKGLVHWVDADKDDFLPAVTPDRVEIRLHTRSPTIVVRPAIVETANHQRHRFEVLVIAPAWATSPAKAGRGASQKKPFARITPGQDSLQKV
jgi:hypothetical protein